MTNSNLSPPAPIILPSTLRLSLSNGRPQRVIPSFLPQTSPCTTHHSAKQRYVNEITETIGGSPRPSPVLLQYVPVLGGAAAAALLIPQVGRRSGGGGPFLDPDCFSHLLKVKATKAAAARRRGEGRRRRRRRKPRWRRKMKEKENTTLLPEVQWLCQRNSVVLHCTHKTAVPVVVERNANSCNEGRIPHLL